MRKIEFGILNLNFSQNFSKNKGHEFHVPYSNLEQFRTPVQFH
jgi:hypothetical protein